MSRVAHALIMAAGRGQRMMPLTSTVPKPMAPFQNSTLIANGIAKLRPYLDDVHVTVGYKGAMLAQHLIEHGVASVINTDGKSNSWWIYNTLLRNLDEPVFVLTCDNVTDLDFAALGADYEALGAPACLLVSVEPVAGLEGDYIFHEDRYVTKLSRSEPAATYCSGIQVINPKRVCALTEDRGDFYTVWSQLMEQRELRVSSVQPSRWFSIDTVADLDRSHADSPAQR